jgi:hypothetical protein
LLDFVIANLEHLRPDEIRMTPIGRDDEQPFVETFELKRTDSGPSRNHVRVTAGVPIAILLIH